MVAEVSQNLIALINLGKLDSTLSRIKAEIKQTKDSMSERFVALEKLRKDLAGKKLDYQEEQAKYNREENRLRDESQKLVDRRKALSSFSNYKVQQSAQKEIETAAKQLSAQEEKLLSTLEELELLEKQVSEATAELEQSEKEFREHEEDSTGKLATLEDRLQEKSASRDEIAARVKPDSLAYYQRIRERYPMDPVVAVQDGACRGCFVQVNAQQQVQIARGETTVTCRGCSRILYLPEQLGEPADAQVA